MKRTFGASAGGKISTRSVAESSTASADDAVRQLRADAAPAGYRERSLKLHGHLCARCGREFSGAGLKLLTVHHKDGNAANNPPDGSNWENLCVYCHDMEHSRELLGDSESAASGMMENPLAHGSDKKGLGTLGELLAARGRRSK